MASLDDDFNAVTTAKKLDDDFTAVSSSSSSSTTQEPLKAEISKIDEGNSALAGAVEGGTAGVIRLDKLLPGVKRDSASFQGTKGTTEAGVRMAPELLNLIPGVGTVAARVVTPLVNGVYGATQSITDDLAASRPVNYGKAAGLATVDAGTALIPGAIGAKIAGRPVLQFLARTGSGAAINASGDVVRQAVENSGDLSKTDLNRTVGAALIGAGVANAQAGVNAIKNLRPLAEVLSEVQPGTVDTSTGRTVLKAGLTATDIPNPKDIVDPIPTQKVDDAPGVLPALKNLWNDTKTNYITAFSRDLGLTDKQVPISNKVAKELEDGTVIYKDETTGYKPGNDALNALTRHTDNQFKYLEEYAPVIEAKAGLKNIDQNFTMPDGTEKKLSTKDQIELADAYVVAKDSENRHQSNLRQLEFFEPELQQLRERLVNAKNRLEIAKTQKYSGSEIDALRMEANNAGNDYTDALQKWELLKSPSGTPTVKVNGKDVDIETPEARAEFLAQVSGIIENASPQLRKFIDARQDFLSIRGQAMDKSGALARGLIEGDYLPRRPKSTETPADLSGKNTPDEKEFHSRQVSTNYQNRYLDSNVYEPHNSETAKALANRQFRTDIIGQYGEVLPSDYVRKVLAGDPKYPNPEKFYTGKGEEIANIDDFNKYKERLNRDLPEESHTELKVYTIPKIMEQLIDRTTQHSNKNLFDKIFSKSISFLNEKGLLTNSALNPTLGGYTQQNYFANAFSLTMDDLLNGLSNPKNFKNSNLFQFFDAKKIRSGGRVKIGEKWYSLKDLDTGGNTGDITQELGSSNIIQFQAKTKDGGILGVFNNPVGGTVLKGVDSVDTFVSDFNNAGDSYAKTMFLLSQVKKGQSPVDAAIELGRVLPTYNLLTPFEKDHLRPLIPFYNYMSWTIRSTAADFLNKNGAKGYARQLVGTIGYALGVKWWNNYQLENLEKEYKIKGLKEKFKNNTYPIIGIYKDTKEKDTYVPISIPIPPTAGIAAANTLGITEGFNTLLDTGRADSALIAGWSDAAKGVLSMTNPLVRTTVSVGYGQPLYGSSFRSNNSSEDTKTGNVVEDIFTELTPGPYRIVNSILGKSNNQDPVTNFLGYMGQRSQSKTATQKAFIQKLRDKPENIKSILDTVKLKQKPNAQKSLFDFFTTTKGEGN